MEWTVMAICHHVDAGCPLKSAERAKAAVINEGDYFCLLATYVKSQHIELSNGKMIPWIDEDLNADNGSWIACEILIAQHGLPENRGRYFNHSGFADLVITGLIGVRPAVGNQLIINPLVPRGKWDYFALEGLPLILAFWFGPPTAVKFGPLGQHWLGFMDGATEA